MQKHKFSMRSPISLYFCTLVTFAACITNLTIASHNLHGFHKTSEYHKSCLQRHPGIWMGQELWLSEHQLSSLAYLDAQYVAQSGMEDAMASGVLRGRPYGGVSIAWSPHLNHGIRPLINYRHKRIICIELLSAPTPIIFASIYMPYFNATKREQCMLETVDAISMIESIIADHPLHNFVIGGDFNTEMIGDSPFDPLWTSLIEKHNLNVCDHLASNIGPQYTYVHESLNQRKWNDHFLVSKNLISVCSDHIIIDDGDNVSDHLPITMTISASLTTAPLTAGNTSRSKPSSLKWDKCTSSHIESYTASLSNLLALTPSLLTFCSDCHCNNQSCHIAIQAEYDQLTSKMKQADRHLPRHKPG